MIDVFVSSLRLLHSSRLICLSRQTHQQLFFFGWSSIKHITQIHININAIERCRYDVEKICEDFIWNENQLKIINYLARRFLIFYKNLLLFNDRRSCSFNLQFRFRRRCHRHRCRNNNKHLKVFPFLCCRCWYFRSSHRVEVRKPPSNYLIASSLEFSKAKDASKKPLGERSSIEK